MACLCCPQIINSLSDTACLIPSCCVLTQTLLFYPLAVYQIMFDLCHIRCDCWYIMYDLTSCVTSAASHMTSTTCVTSATLCVTWCIVWPLPCVISATSYMTWWTVWPQPHHMWPGVFCDPSHMCDLWYIIYDQAHYVTSATLCVAFTSAPAVVYCGCRN